MEARVAREEETPEERVQGEGARESWEKNGRGLLCVLGCGGLHMYTYMYVCVYMCMLIGHRRQVGNYLGEEGENLRVERKDRAALRGGQM